MALHAKFLQLKIYVLEQPIWVGECVEIPMLQLQLVSVTLDIPNLVHTVIRIHPRVAQHYVVRLGAQPMGASLGL
jgi:hypothetical protein